MTGPCSIHEVAAASLTWTPFDTKWVPGTAKLLALGQYARGTGALHVYELEGRQLRRVTEEQQDAALKCAAFGAGGPGQPLAALGDFNGLLSLVDLERPDAPTYSVQAHRGLLNGLDAKGGQSSGHGAPEIATAGRDGWVKVWDPRQPGKPVAAFQPGLSSAASSSAEAGGGDAPGCTGADGHVASSSGDSTTQAGSGSSRPPPEAWCVAIGNSHSDEERCVLAGYDNGDLRLYDLRTGTLRWAGSTGAGVVSVQFDRWDIPQNKLAAACLDSRLCLYDARTQHPKHGLACLSQRLSPGATLWSARFLPSNRDVLAVAAGDGSLGIYKYSYPDKRSVPDPEDKQPRGAVGTMQRVCDRTLSSQPIATFDWSPDKPGLWAAAALDQCLRVGLVSKTELL